MTRFILLIACVLPLGVAEAGAPSDSFEAIPIQAGGKPLIVSDWNFVPAVGDVDGDGRKDLLVGVRSGKLRVYRNVGTNRSPRFNDFTWLHSAGHDAEVPAG